MFGSLRFDWVQLAFIGWMLFNLPASAEIVILEATQDNTLYQDSLGGLSNGAGEYFFAGRTISGSIRRGLIRFDIQGIHLPADAVVTQARVQLHVSRTAVGGSLFSLHRVTALWGEGASDAGSRGGAGAAAQSGDATWLHRRYPGLFWAASGGDFDSMPSAMRLVDGVGSYDWPSTAGLLADIQLWRLNPAANFGWCVIGDETDASAKRFDSRENIDPSSRPKLVIEYVIPPVCPGDQNSDGFVDPEDFPAFVDCLRGPNEISLVPCQCSDFDADLDVDLRDFAALQRTIGK
ncbi:MAG: DNRLRE domain-containing protein [Phycisphaerae bacterium]